jgi:hypothetical protein
MTLSVRSCPLCNSGSLKSNEENRFAVSRHARLCNSVIRSRNRHLQFARRCVSSLAALTNVRLIPFLALNYRPPRTDNVIYSIA